MSSRASTFSTVEVAAPVVAALVLGVALLALLLPLPNFGQSNNSGLVRIYVSVPTSGEGGYASIAHGAQMAVDDAGGQASGPAGTFKIDLVILTDDRAQPTATPQAPPSYHWEADVELANARRAVADPDALAYIGTYNSGAAKISIPVLNRVHLAMISPGNTYPGLTKPGTGTAGEPWIYYPLGIRNYFRVVPADDLQGPAALAYAKQQLGATRAYILDDTELYGHGLAVIVAQAARDLGVTVVGGPESMNIHTTDPAYFRDLAGRILSQNPDLVYFGGSTANNPALLLQALRTAGYRKAFMGADAITDKLFLDQAGAGALSTDAPAVATLVGLPASRLPGAGQDWYQRYKKNWPQDNNEDFAPFGYEATRVAIHAIGQAGKDREKVRAAVAATKAADLPEPRILGNWQFDANGDTSLGTISVLRASPGGWQFQGIMNYDPATKTWAFQQQ